MAMDHKRRKGQKLASRIPYGYTLATDGKTLLVDPTEQATLTTIKELRAAGATIRDIVSHLNGKNILTKGGKPWTPSSVHFLLERIESTASSAA